MWTLCIGLRIRHTRPYYSIYIYYVTVPLPLRDRWKEGRVLNVSRYFQRQRRQARYRPVSPVLVDEHRALARTILRAPPPPPPLDARGAKPRRSSFVSMRGSSVTCPRFCIYNLVSKKAEGEEEANQTGGFCNGALTRARDKRERERDDTLNFYSNGKTRPA